MKHILIIITCLAVGFLIMNGCDEGTIDTLYTNPDAIVDLLKVETAALEAENCDFIETGTWQDIGSALDGDFGTVYYKIDLDSSMRTYDVTVGDTVEVNSLKAKEADAYTKYQNYYTLTLKNTAGDSVVKHFTSNPSSAKKRHYLLQLGSFSSQLRGWVFWATTPILNLATSTPSLTWSSNRQGTLAVSSNTIVRSEYIALSPGERITIQYKGLPSDIAYLNLYEDGAWERVKFQHVSETAMEADWTVSYNFGGKEYYYYAGVEIYRNTTLASSDTTKIGWFYTGLMYRIDDE